MKKRDKIHLALPQSASTAQDFLLPILVLLFAGAAIIILQWVILSNDGDSFTLGAPSPQTYRVISPMRYEDQAAAATLREMASDSVVSVTVLDPSAKARLRRRLEALRMLDSEAGKSLQESFLSYMPEPLLNALSKMNEADRSRLIDIAAQIGEAYMDRAKSTGWLSDSDADSSLLWEEIGKLDPPIDTGDANLVYQILATFGKLNLRTDRELTDRARQTVANDIPAIERRLEIGDVIVSRGDIITSHIARLLRFQGYTEDVFPTMRLCILSVLIFFLPMWLNILGREAGEQRPSWSCTAFLIFVAWLFETLGTGLHLPGCGMVPAVLASCLCTRGAFAFNIALTGTVTSAFIITKLTVSDLSLLLAMAVIASTAGFYLLRDMESRTQISKKVFMLSVILTVIRLMLRWLNAMQPTSEFFRLIAPGWAIWAEYGCYFLFEMLGAHIIIMLLPFVEESMGTLSVLRLRELSHASSPLLRTLQREAPGTYQHCLTIATLIEAVGVDMGMDVNLLKAGAYYHDIGKLRRPQFYVENQQGGFNAHDEMAPSLSAITIISHVNEGLQMALSAKLPRRIRDMIAEHHGTTCVRYFYNKAVAAGDKAEWSDFCYPGPKPQSRESALLMIVDSTEAAVRSMNIGLGEETSSHQNRGRSQYIVALRQLVDQVVNSKTGEGQLSEVNLTHKDINRIKESLVNALLSMYHTRKVKKIESMTESKK